MLPPLLVIAIWGCVAVGIALVVAIREERHPAKLFLIAALLVEAVRAGLLLLLYRTLAVEWVVRVQQWRFALATLESWLWLLVGLTFARGNSDEFLRRWRTTVAAGAVVCVVALWWFWSSLLPMGRVSPRTGLWVLYFGRTTMALGMLQIVVLVACLVQLERTLRAATGTMRWRIKFAILGLGTIVVGRIYASSVAMIFANVDPSRDTFPAVAGLIGGGLFLFSLSRGRLREVDLYLSHKAIFRSITTLLAGIYLLAVGVLTRFAAHIATPIDFPSVAVVILIALLGLSWLFLSDRLRERLRRTVSRHFRRPVHDYRAVWVELTARTASLVQPDGYCRAVVRFLAESLTLNSASLWRVDEQRGEVTLGASTTLTAAQAAALMPTRERLPAFIAVLRAHRGAVRIDTAHDAGVKQMKALSPDVFKPRAGSVCVPLHAGGEVVGFLTLGDRVNGAPFTSQDYDLLDAVGAQIAAGLLTLALAARVADAQEMQAFETMSAFLVHDLKNTASTLGLMLQNMPLHFDDPAFRADALKAMARCVGRIDDVIRRLMALRFKPELHRVETDLNALLRRALADATAGLAVLVETDWGALPPVQADPEELRKVVANLVLNAMEAGGADGRIHVATYARDRQVAFAVRDRGCGIAPEFVERCLFRPFKTTKKQGMGIGLYQCRLIVEAHGGRIDVTTAVGQGSTFTVWLPA